MLYFLEIKHLVAFGENTFLDVFVSIGVFLGLLILLKIFQVVILARLKALAKKTKTDFDDVLMEIFRHIRPPFYLLVSLWVAVQFLVLPDLAIKIVKVIFLFTLIYELIQAVDRVVKYLLERYLKNRSDEREQKQMDSIVRLVQLLVRIGLWIVGLLLILSNLGVNVTSLVASLGIGGLAIALALQNILSDLFSSFSIFMDKPFAVGDFIVVGKDMGTVEKIGLKTTRLKSMKGEELIISNKELTSARIQNFKRLEKRREAFTLGVVYNTPVDKLSKIPNLIEDIVNKQSLAEFDRCHFSAFADSSLNFDIVYFVATDDYAEFMDVKEKINLEIYKAFAQEGIEFAYPTQTIYLERD